MQMIRKHSHVWWQISNASLQMPQSKHGKPTSSSPTYARQTRRRQGVSKRGICWQKVGMSEIQQRSIIKFGKDAYNRPSVDVRDALGIDLFAWVGSPPTPTMGCCMHKDLNYEIRQCRNIAPQTIAHHQLHGASLNHRDNKKGEHDLARHYFLDVIGILLMFADVSNIRYGTDHTIPRTTANPVSLSLLSSGIGWINPIDEIGRRVSTY